MNYPEEFQELKNQVRVLMDEIRVLKDLIHDLAKNQALMLTREFQRNYVDSLIHTKT